MLHPASLPGGTLGGEAYEFVDWLASAGQSWWQVLPLGPPDEGRFPLARLLRVRGLEGFLAEPRRACLQHERVDCVPPEQTATGSPTGSAPAEKRRRPGSLRP